MTNQSVVEAVTFKSATPSVQYIFKNGRVAWFIDGYFKTSDPYKIDELKKEISEGHPLFSVAPAETTKAVLDEFDISGSLRERIRMEIIAEEKAKLRAAGDKTRDMGSYVAPANLNAQNSNDGPMALEGAAIVAATEAAAQEAVNTQAIPAASKAKLDALLKR